MKDLAKLAALAASGHTVMAALRVSNRLLGRHSRPSVMLWRVLTQILVQVVAELQKRKAARQ